MKVKDLKPADYNPRSIAPDKLKMLAKSLAEFGDLSGIIVNKRTGNLIGGHQRIKALDPKWPIESIKGLLTKEDKLQGTLQMGYVFTPFGKLHFREVDWDAKKEKAANIAANKHGGEWDIPKLKDILIQLDDGEFDLSLTGFDEKELQSLIDYVGAAGPVGISEEELKTKFEVIVDCEDESEQQKVFDKLSEQGLRVRVLTL